LKFVGGLRLDRYASRAQDTPSFDIFNTAPLNQIGLDGLQSLRHANMAFTGSLGVVVSPTERVSLTTRIGRSYREPNIFDRYNAGASHTISPTTRSLTAPNPNLKPETGINLDAGVKVRFAKFAGSVAYFNNTYDNFISIFGEPLSGVAPVPGPFGPLTVFQRQNINRIRIQGFEAEAEVPFRLPETLKHSFVTILGNVSYTRGDDVKANRPVDPFLFPVVPLKTVVGARWNTANNRYWSEYRARIVNGQDRLPAGSPFAAPGQPRLGFTAHDLRGGVNFNREHYGVSLTLGVENLGNRFYQDLFSLFGEPARGRAFVTGLRIRFF
jgi:hemoglobin/transferrin/lactoferrin receptor protein